MMMLATNWKETGPVGIYRISVITVVAFVLSRSICALHLASCKSISAPPYGCRIFTVTRYATTAASLKSMRYRDSFSYCQRCHQQLVSSWYPRYPSVYTVTTAHTTNTDFSYFETSQSYPNRIWNTMMRILSFLPQFLLRILSSPRSFWSWVGKIRYPIPQSPDPNSIVRRIAQTRDLTALAHSSVVFVNRKSGGLLGKRVIASVLSPLSPLYPLFPIFSAKAPAKRAAHASVRTQSGGTNGRLQPSSSVVAPNSTLATAAAAATSATGANSRGARNILSDDATYDTLSDGMISEGKQRGTRRPEKTEFETLFGGVPVSEASNDATQNAEAVDVQQAVRAEDSYLCDLSWENPKDKLVRRCQEFLQQQQHDQEQQQQQQQQRTEASLSCADTIEHPIASGLMPRFAPIFSSLQPGNPPRDKKVTAFCCGGDGTVRWVMEEAHTLNVSQLLRFAVVPLGTGNDLFNHVLLSSVPTEEERAAVTSLLNPARLVSSAAAGLSLFAPVPSPSPDKPPDTTPSPSVSTVTTATTMAFDRWQLRVRRLPSQRVLEFFQDEDMRRRIRGNRAFRRRRKLRRVMQRFGIDMRRGRDRDGDRDRNGDSDWDGVMSSSSRGTGSGSRVLEHVEVDREGAGEEGGNSRDKLRDAEGAALQTGSPYDESRDRNLIAPETPALTTSSVFPPSRGGGEVALRSVHFNNYLGIGVDGAITIAYDNLRRRRPHLFFLRVLNKVWYGLVWMYKLLQHDNIQLAERVTLYCDGRQVYIPGDVQGIILLNIRSYAGGSQLWPHQPRSLITPFGDGDGDADAEAELQLGVGDSDENGRRGDVDGGGSQSSELSLSLQDRGGREEGDEGIWEKERGDVREEEEWAQTGELEDQRGYRVTASNRARGSSRDRGGRIDQLAGVEDEDTRDLLVTSTQQRETEGEKRREGGTGGETGTKAEIGAGVGPGASAGYGKAAWARSKWREQRSDDGLIEVVGVTGLAHLAQIKAGLRHAEPLCQGRSVRVVTSCALPMQADGEPWIQRPAMLDISFLERVGIAVPRMPPKDQL